MIRTLLISMLFLGIAAARAVAQTPEPPPVPLPSLSIAGSRLDSTVTYDATRRVYRYAYTIVAAPTNKVAVAGFRVDISGRTEHVPQIDPDLQNNVRRGELRVRQFQPNTTLPVGIVVPQPSRMYCGVTRNAEANFQLWEAGDGVAPGQSAGGFVLESKFPPSPRKAVLNPDKRSWQTFTDQHPPGTLFDDSANYDVVTTALAPWEPDDALLYSGGGQQPAEVNKFLRYAQPADNRVAVLAGTSTYTVVVFYGSTINPATFSATLNGVGITAQFQPVPGSAQAVTIAIGPGTTKLKLSVEGTKASGGRGTDSDTLTFLPQ
jgi:hypothetical protein